MRLSHSALKALWQSMNARCFRRLVYARVPGSGAKAALAQMAHYYCKAGLPVAVFITVHVMKADLAQTEKHA